MKSLALVSVFIGSAAFAHGTIPTSNSISFSPDGHVFLGMNFGAVLIGDQQEFVCERAVSDTQTSVDVWQWLAGGQVAGIVTTGGFVRGVFLAGDGACGFVVAPGTESLLMVDLAPDPLDPNGFVAVGATTGASAEARLVRKTADGVDVLASAPGATATGVRAGGSHVYAVFATETDFEVVHVGDTVERWTITRGADKNLRPLGVDPAAPETAWFVRSTETNDVVLRTDNGGETLEPVATIEARIGGFAIQGTKVWLQSPLLGVHVAENGKDFSVISKSPHGSCLAIGPDDKLYACGVPWQDDMAVGKSDDGQTFTPIITYYDDIVRALDCEGTVELCTEELSFLREYYGFGPALTDEEVGPEAVEAVEVVDEAGPEPTAEPVVETSVSEPTKKPKDDGCAGAGGAPLMAIMFAASRALRRRMTKSPPDRAAHAD